LKLAGSAPIAVPRVARVGASRLATLANVDAKDLDRFLGAKRDVAAGAQPQSWLSSLLRIGPPPRPRTADAERAVHEQSERIQTDLSNAGLMLDEVYADGVVESHEAPALSGASSRIRAVLDLKDSGALAMLPRDVRRRLERRLFAPLETLAAITEEETAGLVAIPDERTVASSKIPDGVDVVAGGLETRAALHRLDLGSLQGGLYTSRGPTKAEQGLEYKAYNEDGALLGVERRANGAPIVIAGAFDQAGGMGKLKGRDGAASQAAALAMRGAALDIAAGGDPRASLITRARQAHEDIVGLNAKHGTEICTTMATGVIVGKTAHIVNAGDSKVWHFSADGRVKNETRSHNKGDEDAARHGRVNDCLPESNIVTSLLGLHNFKPKIDDYAWEMAPGDYLVLASDGVADANLEAQRSAYERHEPWQRINGEITTRHLSSIISRSGGAVDATARIRDYTLRQMATHRGKADNTTVVVLQYGIDS